MMDMTPHDPDPMDRPANGCVEGRSPIFTQLGWGICNSTKYDKKPDCNYDPRYTAEGDWRTGWYETARKTKVLDITALHTLPGEDKMIGSSATVPSFTSSGEVAAVWAVDFTLGTLVKMMDTLQDGLLGTLYYADASGMLLAASGGSTEFRQVPVAAYDDEYVLEGHRLIVAEDGVDYDGVPADGSVIVAEIVVGVGAAQLGKKGEGFVNVVSLARQPLFYMFEDALNTIFIAFVFLSIVLSMAALRIMFRSQVQKILRNCLKADHERVALQHLDVGVGTDSSNTGHPMPASPLSPKSRAFLRGAGETSQAAKVPVPYS